jgi:selenocysteine lyase/cysteine desulfurase
VSEFGVKCSSGEYFLLDTQRWTYLNHGAFGAPLSALVEQAHRWRLHCDRQPLRFIDRELLPRLVESVRAGATLLRAPPTQVVILPNVTTGLNAALRSLTAPLDARSAVLWLDLSYSAVSRLLHVCCAQRDAVPLVVRVPLPFTERTLLDAVRTHMDAFRARHGAGVQVRLCVLDHVTSNTAALLPVRRLCALLRELAPSARIVVDGAHALGSVYPLDVPALGADVYVTNCHKWFLMPRGCALMWAAPAVHACIEHVVISHGFGSGFLSQFVWDGTRDYSTALVLPDAVRLWMGGGGDGARAVVDYCHGLVCAAARLLSAAWGTESLFPESMVASMSMVRVPDKAWQIFDVDLNDSDTISDERAPADETTEARKDDRGHGEVGDRGTCDRADASCTVGGRARGGVRNATAEHAAQLQDHLHHGFRIEVPLKVINGQLYVRISAHVYNYLEQYQKLAETISALLC